MKKLIGLLLLFFCLPSISIAAMQTWADGDALSAVRTKILANDTELYTSTGQAVKIWVDDTPYILGATIFIDGTFYECIEAHLSSAATYPETGATWATAWVEVPLSTSGVTVINDLTDVDTTGKATGKVLKFDASGNLVVGDDEIGASGTGDITGVTAGTGLTGGGDTGAVTLALSQANIDAISANTAKTSFDSTSSTKLGTIAEGATANSPDATLLDRANHTGSQAAATISDFDTEVANNTAVTANTAKVSYTPATPGNIGTTTPGEGHFTTLTAQSFDYGTPAPGTTGEMYVLEDPNNGGSVTGFKAPSQLLTDILYTLPSADGSAGQVLSTSGGAVLSWVDGGAAETDPIFTAWDKDYADLINTPSIPTSVDLTAPGPIGSVTPNAGAFTTLVANSFDYGAPATGETGEIGLAEDPANGTSTVTLKADADIAVDTTILFPSGVLTPAGNLAGIDNIATARANLGLVINTDVQGFDADLADLADGSLTGSKVGTGISGTNVTTGTLPDAVIPATITRDTEVLLLVAAPTLATDICTAPAVAYDATNIYICVATDTWVKAALATW